MSKLGESIGENQIHDWGFRCEDGYFELHPALAKERTLLSQAGIG